MGVWDFIQDQVLGMKWLNELLGIGLSALGLDVNGRIGGSVQFFIYDVLKITVLLCVLIFAISYIQSYFPPERSKRILGRFHGIWANIISALLGTVTPFCSCSSIPLFIGFTSAGLPLGVTFSFLISSPMVDLGSLVLLMSIENNKLLAPEIFLTDSGTTSTARYTTPKEMDVAQWVVTNNKRAGAGTETLSDACCIYLSIRTGDLVYGVMGIAAADSPLDSFETSILLSVLGECALALENQKNLEEKEAAAVLAKNEQLRANLLRSISHDLRTPLTSISGNASNLLSNGNLFDTKTKEQMCMDIYDDAMWLIDLVENLLSVSRLEDGRMNLHISTELIDEVVAEALRHVDRRCAQYNLRVQNSEEYLLAQIDAKLIVQVLINLINNAIKYTPPGTEIDIAWERRGGWLQVSVSDTGPGVSDQAKPHIFDMFYSASDPIADSRRSMGLGLALCKSIINAHGGEIAVADRSPHGAIFTFSVPAGEVELHE